MQVLCIAAVLLSAVAARPDSWRPWQDEKFPPARGPFQRGDDKQSVTQTPEDGEVGSGGDWPEWDSDHPVWPSEMPPGLPNRPSRRPGNGNPRETMEGSDENGLQVSSRRKRQAPGFPTDQSGLPPFGLGRRFGRPRGPPRDKWRNPGALVFSPVFKVDNVTFQNDTDVTLKQGENVFLTRGGRGPHPFKGGRRGPPMSGQYVKLIFNTTEPNTVSIEYGVLKFVLKPSNLDEILGEEDNPEEDY